MSNPHKGPRLVLRKPRRDKSGIITHSAVWIIRDGEHRKSTGCRPDDRESAEQQLKDYIADKQIKTATRGKRHPAAIPVADVIALYLHDLAQTHARPHETAQRGQSALGLFRHEDAIRGKWGHMPTICRPTVN